MLASDHNLVIREAVAQEIVGEFYVWFCADGCAASDSFFDVSGETRELDQVVLDGMLGTLGTTPSGGRGPLYESKYFRENKTAHFNFPISTSRTMARIGS